MTQSVLIAEDEPHIVESLSFLLKRDGFEVRVAADGEAALASIEDARPDVMILDVMLPKIDGFNVLRRLRADPRHVGLRVLMLTAKGQRQDRKTAEAAGADVFMTKPFANAEVVDAVKRLAG